ncbi:MAG TPA: TMEM175 family protein [Solirubrobacterales bacterium]|nr:TMEM175 family protein [Solirubrobacterales bacterium]
MSRARIAQRREENEVGFSRIVAFSDGVFAIAITLLVLNLGVPPHTSAGDLDNVLWDQRQDILAYALSFAIIGRFWIVHHRFFSSVVGFDSRLLGLNLFYLGWIAFFPFSAQVFGDHAGDSAAIVLYAINLAGITLVGMLMMTPARRAGLSQMSVEEAQAGRRRALTIAAVFLVSIPIAVAAPRFAPLLWLALFVDSIGRRVGKRHASAP